MERWYLEKSGQYGALQRFEVCSKPKSKSKKITHLRDEVSVNVDGQTLSELRTYVDDMITNYGPTAHFNIDTYEEYGESFVKVYVSWTREMTPEELEMYKKQSEDDRVQRESYQKQEFDRIKRMHPEWIKEDFVVN